LLQKFCLAHIASAEVVADPEAYSEIEMITAAIINGIQNFGAVGETLQVLFSANVEKALTFLDDRLLPATSNAVERGNRRDHKMQ
jgi:hypothetical protein